jgi:hypothetical protein
MVGHTDALLPEVSFLCRRRIEAIPHREMKLGQQLDSYLLFFRIRSKIGEGQRRLVMLRHPSSFLRAPCGAARLLNIWVASLTGKGGQPLPDTVLFCLCTAFPLPFLSGRFAHKLERIETEIAVRAGFVVIVFRSPQIVFGCHVSSP